MPNGLNIKVANLTWFSGQHLDMGKILRDSSIWPKDPDTRSKNAQSFVWNVIVVKESWSWTVLWRQVSILLKYVPCLRTPIGLALAPGAFKALRCELCLQCAEAYTLNPRGIITTVVKKGPPCHFRLLKTIFWSSAPINAAKSNFLNASNEGCLL